MTCPGCTTTLALKQLGEHVWQQHRLLPYGGAWRPAWDVIAACLDEFATSGDETCLKMAMALATRDNAEGPGRLVQLARQKGLSHPLLPGTGTAGGGLPTVLGVLLALVALAFLLWLLFR
jgi:hypothetical protein